MAGIRTMIPTTPTITPPTIHSVLFFLLERRVVSGLDGMGIPVGERSGVVLNESTSQISKVKHDMFEKRSCTRQ